MDLKELTFDLSTKPASQREMMNETPRLAQGLVSLMLLEAQGFSEQFSVA